MDRKLIKRNARHTLKAHYFIFIVACLFIAILGIKYTDTLNFLDSSSYYWLASTSQLSEDTASNATSGFGFSAIMNSLMRNNIEDLEAQASSEEKTVAETENEKKIAGVSLGRSRGVLASIANKVSSGSLLLSIYAGIRSMIGSKTITNVIFIGASILIFAAFWLIFVNLFYISFCRIFLEARMYKKIPKSRFLYLIRNRCAFKVIRVEIVKDLRLFLWGLTIIGGLIKTYSYFLVPYIIAENPSLTPKEAITLSRKMMNGYKWKTFVYELTFVGWELLSYISLGLVGLFYYNPYKTCADAELYAQIRAEYVSAKKEGYELLNDTYLFQHADEDLLVSTYEDMVESANHLVPEPKFTNPVKKFFAKVFGLVLFYDNEEKIYRDNQTKKLALIHCRDIVNQETYPTRLSPIPITQKADSYDLIRYDRCYSVSSVVAMFFVMSIVGWLWEVSLHFITDGEFVNRGVNHGPWLPIYGTGCVLILIVLNKFRDKIWLEFISAIVLCGFVEYFTSLSLELSHNGKKWWDYTGYFLNINGRVCAEGLLIFGLGGCAFVYFLAPLIDNNIRRVKPKVLIPILSVLVVTYVGDTIYSKFHPNEGKGITDYATSTTVKDTKGTTQGESSIIESSPTPTAVPAESAKS